MTGERNSRVHCREVAFRANPLFRLSHAFIDSRTVDRLIALYALFGAIEETCLAVADEGVAYRKLDWWRNEAKAILDGTGTHPVSVELRLSGAAEGIGHVELKELLDTAETLIDRPAISGQNELASLCTEQGMPMARLELAACGAGHGDMSALSDVAARRGLYRLIHWTFIASDGADAWWIPLDLQARHGVGRAELADSKRGGSFRALIAETCSYTSFERPCEPWLVEDISALNQLLVNLLLIDELLIKKLQFTNMTSGDIDWMKWTKPGVGDLFTTWRAARRLNLSK